MKNLQKEKSEFRSENSKLSEEVFTVKEQSLEYKILYEELKEELKKS